MPKQTWSFGNRDQLVAELRKQEWKKNLEGVRFKTPDLGPVGAGGVGRQEVADAAGTELWAGRGAAGRAPDRGAS